MSRYADLLPLKTAGSVLGRLQTIEAAHLGAGVSESYCAFLREIGFGEIGGAFMLYGGPVQPAEIFGSSESAWKGVVLVGDDLAGWMTGLRLADGSVVEGGPPYEASPVTAAPDFGTYIRALIGGLPP